MNKNIKPEVAEAKEARDRFLAEVEIMSKHDGEVRAVQLDKVVVAEPVQLDERDTKDTKIPSNPRSIQPVAAALATQDGSASQIVQALVVRGDVTDEETERRLVNAIVRNRRQARRAARKG